MYSSERDHFAGVALASTLNAATIQPELLSHSYGSSMTVAVAETRQGLYQEYTVEKVDDSALDEIKRSYKTAEETDLSKNKVQPSHKILFSSPVAVVTEIYLHVYSTGQYLQYCLLGPL